MTTTHSESTQVDDLADRLASHDIRYLQRSVARPKSSSAPLSPLLEDLARAPGARLRSSLVALLLHHPEHASVAEAVGRTLSTSDPARQVLLLGIIVASALQSKWSFSLDLYVPSQVRIQGNHLAAQLGLPSPRQDFGRPCLAAAARLARKDDVFPTNYEADWENVAHRLLSQLLREAPTRGA